MDGEAGWWTTSGNIGLSPLARVMGMGRQQQQQDWVKKCMEIIVEGRRPRRTWLESVEADMTELEIDKEDVHDRKQLRRNVMKRKFSPIGKRDMNR